MSVRMSTSLTDYWDISLIRQVPDDSQVYVASIHCLHNQKLPRLLGLNYTPTALTALTAASCGVANEHKT